MGFIIASNVYLKAHQATNSAVVHSMKKMGHISFIAYILENEWRVCISSNNG